MRPLGWRFNVFWQESSGVGGSGGDSATDSSASGTGTDAGPSGGATGFSVGINAPSAAAVNAASNAATAYGGGRGGIGFGGQTSAGGFGGGQTAAVGGPTGGGAGTAAGGSAPGPAGSGTAGVRGGSLAGPGGINLANAIASLASYGDVAVPPGYATGVPTATSPVSVSNLGPPSLNPSVIAQLNSLFSVQSPALSQLASQLMGNTLGGLAPGGAASIGQGTMGYPSAAIAAVPGGGYGSVTTPGAQIGQATITAPSEQVAKNSEMEAIAPALASLGFSEGNQAAPTETADAQTTANQNATQAQQDISQSLSNPTMLAQLAQAAFMALMGSQWGQYA